MIEPGVSTGLVAWVTPASDLARATVVLEPIDPSALAILRALDAPTLEAGKVPITAGTPLYAIDASLAGAKPGALAAAQLAAPPTLLDALVLTPFASLHAQRAGVGARTRRHQAQQQPRHH